ncbi:MAG TPA: nucleotidyltransferase family protein, partial [Actinomycetota bacterium]|nr:nucleotidyltransferase family protein [Actinomycetota bacterium]
MSSSTTGLVLAAGGSSRLGEPKQILPYRGTTLLGHVLDTARACPFDQRIVVLGGANEHIRDKVDLSGFDLILNESFGEGCSSSIAAALSAVRGDTMVLLLGDQPGVEAGHVTKLLEGRGDAPLAACRYDDGRGHPLAFARSTFAELQELHGDKGVWKLLDRSEVVEVPVEGRIPLDV